MLQAVLKDSLTENLSVDFVGFLLHLLSFELNFLIEDVTEYLPKVKFINLIRITMYNDK